MKFMLKKTSWLILSFLCVWFLLQLIVCKRAAIKAIDIYALEAKFGKQVNSRLDVLQKEDSQLQQDDVIPLSVNYNGPPIILMYESGYEINPKLCSGRNRAPELLIMIQSSNVKFDFRTAIRYTWKHFDKMDNVLMVFFIGRSNNQTIMDQVRKESEFYEDVVVTKTYDMYNNLTLKTISMCEWVNKFCPNAKFVLKSDDDVFLNVPLLMDFIRQPEVSSAKRSVYGKLNHGTSPVRYRDHKFYISFEEYSSDIYLDYMQGASYLFTSDIAGPLYRTALQMDFFRMEDIFLTGFVSERIQAKKVNVEKFYILYYEMWLYKTVLNETIYYTDPCDVKKMIAIHYVDYNAMFTLWYHFFDRRSACK